MNARAHNVIPGPSCGGRSKVTDAGAGAVLGGTVQDKVYLVCILQDIISQYVAKAFR